MAKPVLAIDIDEVLFPFTEHFLNKHNQEHGTSIETTDLQNYYYIEQLKGVSEQDVDDLIEEFLEDVYAAKLGPKTGVVEAITQLKDKYDIDVITARRPSTRDITEKWLKHHFPNTFRGVYFPRELETEKLSKPQLCKQIGAEYLIDDHIENIIGSAELGIKAYLFGDYPWAKEWNLPQGAKRVKDWDEVLKELL